MLRELYTIGHSNHSQEDFLGMIRKYGINCIVDVRSLPASKHTPQFNQYELKWFLKQNGIFYLHMGYELGARRTDCIGDDGQVDFERAAKTPAFQNGVQRIENGMQKRYHIALMCSEANPLECHRFSLVSRHFHDQGVDVKHILKDGMLTTHVSLEQEMIDGLRHSPKHKLAEVDLLFGTYTEKEQRWDAYRLKNKEIGHHIRQDSEVD